MLQLEHKSVCGHMRHGLCVMVIQTHKCTSYSSDSHSEHYSTSHGQEEESEIRLTSVRSSCCRCFRAHVLEGLCSKWVLGSDRLRWSPCEDDYRGPAVNCQTNCAVGLESHRHNEMLCDKLTALDKNETSFESMSYLFEKKTAVAVGAAVHPGLVSLMY